MSTNVATLAKQELPERRLPHANASSSTHGRCLMEMLAAGYHAVALIAAVRHCGRSSRWQPLYMERSLLSSRSVARLLTKVLPRVAVIEFEGLGHMGPVTHPAVVNTAIDRFIAKES